MKRYPRILYFIKGVMPSVEAQEIAEQYGPNVAFRNANFVPSSGAPEKCDGVAGAVPELYNKFPKAEDALKAFEEQRKAAKEAAKEGKEKRAKQAEEDAKKKKAEDAKKAEENKNKVAPAKANKPSDWKPNA